MPTISLTLKTLQAEANLQATDITDANAGHIIHGLFSVFGTTTASLQQEVAVTVESPPAPKPTPAPAPAQVKAAISKDPPLVLRPETTQAHNDAPPINPMAEKLQSALGIEKDEASQPEHWVTGIKHKSFDGVPNVPHYKTYYRCPNPKCKHKGRHYIPEGLDHTQCHQCDTLIAVKDATMKGFPERDLQGNYFIGEGYYHSKA